MQELQEDYGSQGLVVLALSNEDSEKVAKYVQDMGVTVRAAAGFSTGGEWGVTGYPSAALIDPEGTVVWTGHPSSLSDSTVKAALKGAKAGSGGYLSYRVQRELVPALERAAQAAFEGDLGKAYAMAQKLAQDEKADAAAREDAQVFAGELLGFGELLRAQAESLIQRGSVVRGLEVLEAVQKEFKGTELGAALQTRLDEIAKDDHLQQELAAEEAWIKALEAVEKRGLKKSAAKFEAIVKKYPDTKAAERAAAKLRGL
ncbi:MAG: TlpA family protein disulfide reductase [Planctomycetes bacterium]|nr:TlpA family protein disulfide reductase [Planctomycetota bacterium]